MKAKKKSKKKYVVYINGGIVQSKPTEKPKKKTDYEIAMEHLISKKGGTAAEYEDLMNRIAFHETGAEQRMMPDAIQIITNEKGEKVKGGVGRGLFQFEAGEKAGGITAVNRTYREYKDNNLTPPEFLEEAYKEKSLDASKLTAEQQKILFIGNYLQHPKANLKDWREGKVTTPQFWGQFHHAGGKSTDYDAFNESQKAYDKK